MLEFGLVTFWFALLLAVVLYWVARYFGSGLLLGLFCLLLHEEAAHRCKCRMSMLPMVQQWYSNASSVNVNVNVNNLRLHFSVDLSWRGFVWYSWHCAASCSSL